MKIIETLTSLETWDIIARIGFPIVVAICCLGFIGWFFIIIALYLKNDFFPKVTEDLDNVSLSLIRISENMIPRDTVDQIDRRLSKLEHNQTIIRSDLLDLKDRQIVIKTNTDALLQINAKTN